MRKYLVYMIATLSVVAVVLTFTSIVRAEGAAKNTAAAKPKAPSATGEIATVDAKAGTLEFLQKLAGRKLPGFFLRDDRPYDHGTVTGFLSQGYVTLTALDIAHTNLFGVRDLGVAVVPTQNRISLEHLVTAIRTAARRGKPARDEGDVPAGALPQTEFKWLE